MSTRHCGNWMLTDREHERHLLAHKKKVKEMPAQINNNSPQEHLHLELRLKRLETEEQRKREIDRENRILLEKMSVIMASKNEEFQTEKSKDKKHNKSLNFEQRKHQQDILEEENIKAAKRLENTKPIYSSKKWEKDYEQKQKLVESWQRTKNRNQKNISKFFKTEKSDRHRSAIS